MPQPQTECVVPGQGLSGAATACACLCSPRSAASALANSPMMVDADAENPRATPAGLVHAQIRGTRRVNADLPPGQTRPLVQQTKSGKDLHQAALLPEVPAEDRPDDLERTGRALQGSGPAAVLRTG